LVANTEERLVWLAKTGDREAFSQLVLLFELKVYRTAYALTGNEHDAKDLSQETFVRAFRGIGRFRGKSSFFTWLYRILLNTYKGWAKRSYRTPEVLLASLRGSASNDLHDTKASSSDAACDREKVDRVYRAIAALPHEQKMAIVLHAIEEMTYREIARAMQCSIGTIKSRIHAARLALKRQLLDEEEGRTSKEYHEQ
jgi:RNA polymerase sigma-70 factor (ECF subfamily)